MGMLVEGHWHSDTSGLVDHDGALQRPESVFRNWITADGVPGPTGEGGFEAEPGRYHLYVARACPWAHRATLFRELKGLQPMIGLSVTHWLMADDGWTFATGPGVIPDPLHDVETLWQLYVRADAAYTGRVTVPVLWDTRRETIVSNESADIIRMFNSAFDGLTGNDADFCPESLRGQIDALNTRIYDTVNNGVYKAGFATSQAAYDKAIGPLFQSLDWIEGLLAEARYLAGDRVTEADWRLFTTICRFDSVYHTHFKCNRQRIVDYPNLWGWARELYQWPGVAATVRQDHITRHYYFSHDMINPNRIIPIGPEPDWTVPHGRG